MKIKIVKIPRFIEIFTKNLCLASGQYVLLSKKVYDNYKSEKPDISALAIIAHEKKHVERQRKMGYMKWIFLYFFSKKFCLLEEIEAIKEELNIYKANNLKINLEEKALFISTNWIYNLFHKIQYKEAKSALESLQNK